MIDLHLVLLSSLLRGRPPRSTLEPPLRRYLHELRDTVRGNGPPVGVQLAIYSVQASYAYLLVLGIIWSLRFNQAMRDHGHDYELPTSRSAWGM